ncbi:MAG: hypothetical protein F6K54_33175 [Okeania sp. SIO3B5]|uniref:hypothetical protein n=1 Tax=Okeania sp. SIO3B5 TaxID=2607811 RepID=UPI0014000EE3|nr:hypothetical protein [Okeania sp. SIO3B5]NEO57499.1 hypothetical protein [Okeania sp. SIO3B5]
MDNKIKSQSVSSFWDKHQELLSCNRSRDQTKHFSMALTPSLKKLINEYAILASLPELNLEQEEKLGEILEQANQNQILAFWIAEVDYILGESLGLLKPENLNYYEDQKAVLREHFSSDLTYLDIDEFGSEKLEIQEKIS